MLIVTFIFLTCHSCFGRASPTIHAITPCEKQNRLVNVKEISETMTNMAREMEKAGLVEEIIGDTMESLEVR